MEHRPLGGSGIEVSRLILGCGNFGGIGSSPAFFGKGTSRADAFALLDAAWDAGITTIDTADAYGGGLSESFIGAWLATKDASVRDTIAITTKTYNPMSDGADHGLAPARVARQVDASLARLGVGRVALFLAHEFDTVVPIGETLGELHRLVRAGKIGAVGASNVTDAQLDECMDASSSAGVIRYEWVQNAYSLLERGDEAAVLPACAARGLGYTPFSPLAGGWLTGKYRRGEPPPSGSRMTLRPEPYARYGDARMHDSLDELRAIATARGTSMAALAIAWTLAQPSVTAIVIGPNRVEQLAPALEAAALDLERSVIDRLSEVFA